VLPLPPFEWLAPRDLDAALAALAEAPADTVLVAGGTDVVPHLKYGRYTPRRVLGLGRVAELGGLTSTDDGGLRVGAAVSLEALTRDPRIVDAYPALAMAAAAVGAPQIRRMGTLGGNLCLDTRCAFFDQSEFWRTALGHCLKTEGDTCHVVPGGRRCVAALAADTPGPLIAYGATLELRSVRGARTLALADFYGGDGVRHHGREPDEILVSVRLPAPTAALASAYVKVRARQAVDFPLLAVAAAVTADDVRLVVTALGPRPRRIHAQGADLRARPLTAAAVDALAVAAQAQCHPLPNLGAAAWRAELVAPTVRRALATLRPSRLA
jgi:4-hydroxybenzoyl-CoA reductase subunit beta